MQLPGLVFGFLLCGGYGFGDFAILVRCVAVDLGVYLLILVA